MKIDTSSITTALTGSSSQGTRAEKSVSAPTSNASTVSLSDAAAKIQALEQSAQQSSGGFDAARVAALKQGNFRRQVSNHATDDRREIA